jgi:hypothetical protein
MQKSGVQGPLNRAYIDSVTFKSHDHFTLWNTTNLTLGNHQNQINSQASEITALREGLNKTSQSVRTASGGGGSSSSTVTSVFGRTGGVKAQTGDYTVTQVTGAAPLASPALTGTSTAPTPTTGDNSTRLATTAFVQSALPGPINFADSEIPSGLIDGSNKTFTLANSPNPAVSLMLFYNGQLWMSGGSDYTLSGSTITSNIAPHIGDELVAYYRY